MSEEWRHIDAYGKFYQVSNLGNVRSQNGPRKIKIAKNGYAQIGLCSRGKVKWFLLHRVVYQAFRGKTDLQIDHINEIKTDNRLCNLQALNSHDNNIKAKRHNKTSKYPGVHLYHNGKWKAQIGIGGKKYALGYFEKEEDAYRAYLKEKP